MISCVQVVMDNVLIDELDIIDHHDHLSEIEVHPLSEEEIGIMCYYDALVDSLTSANSIT